MTETIASTLDDYVSKAIELGRNATAHAALKRRIAENKQRLYRDDEYITALEAFLDRAARSGPSVSSARSRL